VATNFFQNWSDRLVKVSRVWQSAAVLSRYLEYLNKLEYHFSFFKSYADSLSATRHLTDLPWLDIKPELWFEAVRGFREKLVQGGGEPYRSTRSIAKAGRRSR
jgi:hypothetical protein